MKQANEVERDMFYFRKALAFILANPIRFVELTAVRFVSFWVHIRGKDRPDWQRSLTAGSYFAVLSLAVASLLYRASRRLDARLLWFFILSLPIPYYFTIITDWRYRFPVEVIGLVFAAYTLYRLVHRKAPEPVSPS